MWDDKALEYEIMYIYIRGKWDHGQTLDAEL